MEINIGETYGELGEFDKSESHYRRGLSVAIETNNLELRGSILVHIGLSLIGQKKYKESLDYLIEGVNLARVQKNIYVQKMAYENMAIASEKRKMKALGLSLDEKMGH